MVGLEEQLRNSYTSFQASYPSTKSVEANWTQFKTILFDTIKKHIPQKTLSENTKPSITKRFWQYIKAKHKDSSGIPILKSDGKEVTDSKQKADILNKQYNSVFQMKTLYYQLWVTVISQTCQKLQQTLMVLLNYSRESIHPRQQDQTRFQRVSLNSLRSRRLEVVGERENGRARERHARGEAAPARKAPEKSVAKCRGSWVVGRG